MGTLSDRLADAVACGSISANRKFDVGWSFRSALQSAHLNLITRESLTTLPAVGADCFRDSATLATSL
jgi:hypothetical protein